MQTDPNINHVEELIKKAAEAKDSGDAMRLSQAACNSANTLIVLNSLRNK